MVKLQGIIITIELQGEVDPEAIDLLKKAVSLMALGIDPQAIISGAPMIRFEEVCDVHASAN